MRNEISLNIPMTWSYTAFVRQEVDAALTGHPDGIRQAAQTVSSELVENAIKYGHSVPEVPQAKFVMNISDDSICIEVSNGVKCPQEVDEIAQRIETIQKAEDKEELFLSRMQEVIEDPTQLGRLGLVRIASECKFELSYECNEQILTVRAVRGFHG